MKIKTLKEALNVVQNVTCLMTNPDLDDALIYIRDNAIDTADLMSYSAGGCLWDDPSKLEN